MTPCNSAPPNGRMDEPDTRIQLGISAQALLKTKHTDERESDLPTVIRVAQLLEPSRPESIWSTFINNDEPGLGGRGCCGECSCSRSARP
jgi:hypothetical protein